MTRLFQMDIRPEARMIPAALAATREVAGYFFEHTSIVDQITLALEEAICNITEYCATEQLKSISIEAAIEDATFVLTVTDQGLPGDLETILNDEKGIGISLMRGLMDRLQIENLGHAGRRQRLYKMLERMPDFGPRRQPDAGAEITGAAPAEIPLVIRPVRETETVEVARCIYDEFGMTYPMALVYSPKSFWAAVQRGEIISLVAVTEAGEVAAHLALWPWSVLPGIWEMGMGVVKHRFRNAHVMGRLSQEIRDRANRDLGLAGLMTEPVLYHPYTQKAACKLGFHACGAGFAYTPANLNPSMNPDTGRRSNVAMSMAVFRDIERVLHLPAEVRPLVEDITSRMGLARHIAEDSEPNAPPARPQSAILAEAYAAFGIGRICVYHVGADIRARLRALTAHLKRQGVTIIELFLQACEPGLPFAYAAAKETGFFCTGFLPLANDGDMLVMENLLAQAVDYDALSTVEPFTSLLQKIRALDPDQGLPHEHS